MSLLTTAAQVRTYQREWGLHVDGVAGSITRDCLAAHRAHTCAVGQGPWKRASVTLTASGGPGWGRVSNMRQDAATALQGVADAVSEKGGVLRSAGAVRKLGVPGGKGRAMLSDHKLRTAVDFALPMAANNAAVDPLLLQEETVDGRVVYRLFARADGGEKCIVEAWVGKSPRRVTIPPTRVVDVTALLQGAGFKRIPARPGYAEWWHYGYIAHRVVGVTTYGDELARAWRKDQLGPSEEWRRFHHYVWSGWGWVAP